MIIKRDELKEIIEKLKGEGKKIVFTNGCFDIIHPGHVSYLTEAKDLGDVLLVALNTDESVSRLKGPSRPLNSLEDRSIVMNALKPVDLVTSFHEDTPLEIISEIYPDLLVKGGDYEPEQVVGKDIVESNGGKLVLIQFVDGKSTTRIIEKMQAD